MKYPKKIKSRHERPTFAEVVSLVTDIPADLFTNGMTLEMRGRNELLLCGCSEIIEYSKNLIRVIQGGSMVCVIGRRLAMSSYSLGRISITGEIDSLDFCGGEERDGKTQNAGN